MKNYFNTEVTKLINTFKAEKSIIDMVEAINKGLTDIYTTLYEVSDIDDSLEDMLVEISVCKDYIYEVFNNQLSKKASVAFLNEALQTLLKLEF